MEELLRLTTQTLSFERIPAELQKRIANFLKYRDAFRLSQVNKQIKESLGMSTIRLPSAIPTKGIWAGSVRDGDIPRRCRKLPFLMKNRVHTVLLRGMYQDQGWGNQKGRFYIVASGAGFGHRVVATSPLANHGETALKLEFNTVDDDATYTLWYKVGGGGGHTLTLANLTMQLIIFDEPGLCISKNFHALNSRKALGVSLSYHYILLRSSARALLAQMEREENPDINMASFMESTGIDVTKRSLLALDQIASSMLNLGNYSEIDVEPSEESGTDIEIRRQCFPWSPAAPSGNPPSPQREVDAIMALEPDHEILEVDIMDEDVEDMIRRAMRED